MTDPVVLKVYRGTRLISVKQFLTPQIVIGRKSDSSLALDDETISPLHAMIERRGDEFFISDLGSETGVSVEGVKILETQIHSGEAVNLGPYSVRFYIGVPTPAIKENFDKDHQKPEKTKGSSVSMTLPPEVLEVDADNSNIDDIPEDRVPPPVPSDDVHLGFDDDETEATDPGFDSDDVEHTDPGLVKNQNPDNTDPGIVSDSAITIDRIDEESQIQNQLDEPAASGYYASASTYDNIDEILDPSSRGSVVQVLICWKERVLKTYNFSNSKSVYLSNVDGSDVFVPLVGPNFKQKLLTLSDTCRVHLSSSMAGTLYKNGQPTDVAELVGDPQIGSSGSGTTVDLEQGQMLQINLMSDRIVAFVSYVEDAPKAASSPVLDFTSSEIVGVFMSAASIAILALYMLFYAPASLNDTDKLLEDRLKKAVITFNPPPVAKLDKLPKPPPPKPKKPIKTKITEKAVKPKPKKAVKAQVKAGVKKPKTPTVDKSKPPGKPKEAAPSRVKTKNNTGSSRPGGSVKTGKKAANMKSEKKDLTATGILSVLSGGGKNTALDKASSGVGDTIGMSDQKTGYQGQLSDQAGEGIGTKLQKAGKGGQGSALAGAGDIKTSGRGGGEGGYGVAGLGGKGNSTIVNVDGGEGEFSSSIDKEAIRRLIRRNKNAIAACYERALVTNNSLSGKVVLSWNIVSGGKMTSPKVVSSTMSDKSVEKCLIRRLMGLTFPSPAENEIAEVGSYPFVFESGK